MNIFKVAVIVAGVALAGCFERPVIHEQGYQEFEVVGIDRPKHFRVDLKRVVGGAVYKNVSVSKHCNRWREVYIGQRFKLLETTYHYKESGRFSTHIEARPVCPR